MTTKSLRIGGDGKAIKKASHHHKHHKKKHKKHKNGQKTGATKKRSQSPVSRYALFAVALLLPLRRRLRGSKSESKTDGSLPF